MRENRSLDQRKLPTSVYELWLSSQQPTHVTKRAHRTPPQDAYEAWVEKRVEKKTPSPKEKRY